MKEKQKSTAKGAKYTLTPEALRQRQKAAKVAAVARSAKPHERWVGTSVYVSNKEWAVSHFGSLNELVNEVRRTHAALAVLLGAVAVAVRKTRKPSQLKSALEAYDKAKGGCCV